jgi:hypothetical protein
MLLQPFTRLHDITSHKTTVLKVYFIFKESKEMKFLFVLQGTKVSPAAADTCSDSLRNLTDKLCG